MRERGDTRDRGAAAVEFGLLLPVILLVVLGAIDFGRMYNAQITLTQAAREGARYAALGITSPTPASRTLTAAAPLTGINAPVVTACPSTPTPTSNATVTVTRVFTVSDPAYSALRAISNRFGGGLPSTITITGTATMRCLG